MREQAKLCAHMQGRCCLYCEDSPHFEGTWVWDAAGRQTCRHPAFEPSYSFCSVKIQEGHPCMPMHEHHTVQVFKERSRPCGKQGCTMECIECHFLTKRTLHNQEL